MATRMLIDARHPEETRVAVLKGNRIEEFDFESAEHKQIKGNIYLAKVTRVEPSLQAAFVDFGGNRHGFLAFSEIHPDYYQIPQSDRDALIEAEREHAEEEAALRAAEEEFEENLDEDGDLDDQAESEDGDDEDAIADDDDEDDDNGADAEGGDDEAENGNHEGGRSDNRSNGRRGRPRRQGRQGRAQTKEMDELREKRQALRRRYKIQDVIQRRQVLLVQVVKEERGNKGAALTTYLSLAGRYCVLMPNSSSGGGISRKISSSGDRKRLKQIVSELSLPRSMGLIVRTAGLQRTKTEIKRDFDYLARLWDDIREKTMSSSAPSAIHSDSDLVKRAIRDIYNRDIEEVIVEGEAGYRAARTFMKLLMPSHVRKVKAYSDPVPLFQRFGAEDQLTAMYDPVVQLKSGGYLVINPTEALVSIDINSGRSTKELGIEQTAVATNIEAANEIARQLRLRDMAGLVVIDFIDMEYGSNVRKVEKCMREALKNDRARIQVGRISSFGLMEMSRQRLRTGVLEATTRGCPHCDGTGLVRTASSAGLSALRFIEDEAAKGKGTVISLFASTEAAIYLLNAKRADLSEIEHRYGVEVEVIPEGENEGAKMRVTSSGPRPLHAPRFDPIVFEDDDDDDIILEDEEFEDEDAEGEAKAPAAADASTPAASNEDGEDGDGRRKRRRRRRGGRGRNRQRDGEESSWSESNGEGEQSHVAEDDDQSSFDGEAGSNDADADDAQPRNEASQHGEQGEEGAPRKRRRRGGRRRRRSGDEAPADERAQQGDSFGDQAETVFAEDSAPVEASAPAPVEVAVESAPEPVAVAVEAEADAPAAAPKPKRTRRKKAEPVAEVANATVEAATAEPAADVAEEAAPKPKRTRRKKVDADAEAPAAPVAAEAEAATEEAPKPKRTRRKKADGDAEAAEAAPAKALAKPRARRTTKASTAAAKVEPATPAPAAEPAAAPAVPSTPADSAAVVVSGEGNADGAPRRGWWQRTFGA